ncbi:hypothetical protein [Propioniciclava soli]|uniref:hypothetical protein n=1 Tax=Propioniciclava soli TaxID=2775081 RepID=UPI001E559583|nr:hypothetical protein [Propioniciclava soli]
MTTLLPRPAETETAASPPPAPAPARRPDGWLLLALAVILGSSLAVAFQAFNLLWGPVVLGLALGWLALGLVITALVTRRAEGPHRRTDRRAVFVALGWCTLVALVGGWWWVGSGPHATTALVTSSVAALAVVPLGVVGLRLRSASR